MASQPRNKNRFTDFLRSNAAIAGRMLDRARDTIAIAASDIIAPRGQEDYRHRFLRYFNSREGREAQQMSSGDGISKAREIINDREGRLKTKRVSPGGNQNPSPQSLSNQNIGNLFLFAYRSKWFYKDKLPYYDAFPLIFLISNAATLKNGKVSNKHFLGINFHYLAPRERALLMDAINVRLLRNGFDPLSPNYNPRLYARITYDVLRAAARHRAFRPAVKMYLKSNATRMVRIPGDQWEHLLFLPIARWRFSNASRYSNDAKSQQQIWRESTRSR